MVKLRLGTYNIYRYKKLECKLWYEKYLHVFCFERYTSHGCLVKMYDAGNGVSSHSNIQLGNWTSLGKLKALRPASKWITRILFSDGEKWTKLLKNITTFKKPCITCRFHLLRNKNLVNTTGSFSVKNLERSDLIHFSKFTLVKHQQLLYKKYWSIVPVVHHGPKRPVEKLIYLFVHVQLRLLAEGVPLIRIHLQTNNEPRN